MVLDPNKNMDPKCIFCSEDLGFDRTKRVRHIGRHMEEIAFAIVTKPYEAWDFYSVSSERYLDGQGLWHSKPTWYPCICHDCGLKLHTVAERAKHFVSIHGLSVAEARAQSGGGHQCHRSNIRGQPPCNTLFSTPMDLKTHVFISHTKGGKIFCERCNWGDLLLSTCYSTRWRTLYSINAAEQVQCGLCGDLVPRDELFAVDDALDTGWIDVSESGGSEVSSNCSDRVR